LRCRDLELRRLGKVELALGEERHGFGRCVVANRGQRDGLVVLRTALLGAACLVEMVDAEVLGCSGIESAAELKE
jgi:hypothetical protein